MRTKKGNKRKKNYCRQIKVWLIAFEMKFLAHTKKATAQF